MRSGRDRKGERRTKSDRIIQETEIAQREGRKGRKGMPKGRENMTRDAEEEELKG